MADIELKPCPFCGACACVDHRTYPSGDKDYIVICLHDSGCYLDKSISVDFETEEEAAEAWNRRVDNG